MVYLENNEKPSWLKRMENGTIAEARTKALLMDRFWILERSVDIHGVDFIIQRRLTSKNLLDDQPPRFGVVQVKFIQDEKTTSYLRQEYVCDQKGNPRSEFFLIIHNGKEENKRKFLLSSEDIVKYFAINEDKTEKVYMIPGRSILPNSRFEVLSDTLALDRIEQALIIADFMKNRRFVSWVLPSYIDFSPDDIKSDYIVPLDNWWGDIPEYFYSLKKDVKSLVFDLTEITEPLQKILTMTDPSEALSVLEDLQAYIYPDGYFKFNANIYSQDFHNVVEQHRKKVAFLRDKGFLDRFVGIQKKCEEYICFDLAPKMILARDLAYVLEVMYEPIALNNCFFKSKIIPKKEIEIKYPDQSEFNIDYYGIVNSSPGEVSLFFVPGRLGYEENDDRSWKEKLKDKTWMIIRPLMDEIYDYLVSECYG